MPTETIADHFVDVSPEQMVDCAPTIVARFDALQHLVEGSKPPVRPNRTFPVHLDDQALTAELEAWEAASDEVWNDNAE